LPTTAFVRFTGIVAALVVAAMRVITFCAIIFSESEKSPNHL
jgi:hypothetical protein